MIPALEVTGLRFAYDSEPVLDGISFQIAPGESVGLAGANGSGKSTLLWCVAGLLRASGRTLLFGAPLTDRSRTRMGMVFQNPEDQLFMPTLAQDLALPLLNSGLDPGTARERAMNGLRAAGLEQYGDRPATHLSLGQRKRAAVALGLIRSPELLLMDEPTAELDGRATRLLSGTLNALGVAKLIASHDLGFLRTVTTRTMVLAGGRIVADGPTSQVLSDDDMLRKAALV